MNIVIKLPDETRERILTFPFLQSLNKYFLKVIEEKETEDEEDDEILNIHLISLKKDIDILNLLPFRAYYHELEEEDVKNVFSVHRACVNFKIDRPDIFICASEGFVDASIGKQLGIKDRVGFDLGKSKWFFNKKITFLDGQHKTVQYFNLLKAFFEELPTIPNAFSRSLDPAYADWRENPYTVINLDLVDNKVNPEWNDFFELFTNKNFVFMTDGVPLEEQRSLLDDFIKTLPTKNTYKVFEYASNIAFGKLISHCVTFVTHDSFLMHLASYIGAHTFYINRKENFHFTGPEYLLGEVRNFSLSDPAYKSGNAHDYAKVFDEVYSYIDDKTAVETED